MEFCCKKMRYFLSQKEKENFDSDDVIYYSPKFDEYGIVVHDSGNSYILIEYCPWCGKKLPESRRDNWFLELEKLGIECPLEEEIPEQFRSDKWWMT